MNNKLSRALATILMVLFSLSPVWATCGGGGGGGTGGAGGGGDATGGNGDTGGKGDQPPTTTHAGCSAVGSDVGFGGSWMLLVLLFGVAVRTSSRGRSARL